MAFNEDMSKRNGNTAQNNSNLNRIALPKLIGIQQINVAV
jgi:hypothetical protein